MNKFWKFINSADGESAELLLYGPISEASWWGDEVTPAQFNADLAGLGDVKSIKVRINSPGGDVFAAAAIHNSLKNHKASVTAYVDGLAASAASVVAMAGDEVVMPANAMMMIHNPLTIAWGDAREMRKMADVLDKVRDTIIAAYESKTGRSRAELISMMNSETWMTAADAVEQGFADRIDQGVQVSASVRGQTMIVNGIGFDLSKFRTIPAAFAATAEVKPPLAGVDNTEPVATGQDKQEGHVMSEPTKVDQANTQPVATDAEPIVEPSAAPTAEPAQASEPAAEPTPDPVQDAVTTERARIQAILGLSQPGMETIINAAIADGATVEETSHRILTSDEFKASQALAARRADAAAANGVTPGAGDPAPITDEWFANATPAEIKARRADVQAYLNGKRQKGT